MSYWYLASPYSKYPYGLSSAHLHACRACVLLITAGIPVFSPIAHSHPIAMTGGLDPLDHDIWLPADKPMVEAAGGLIVLKLEGWSRSIGVAEEIEGFAEMNKPIVYMEPGEVPVILFQEGK